MGARDAVTGIRLLVTGATGFVGRHCLPLLSRPGVAVHATTRSAAGPVGSGVTWHSIDLLDPAAGAAIIERIQPTHLLHLAWDVPPGAWAHAPAHLEWTVAGLALLRAFIDAGGQRAVCAGSCAEYDWRCGVCSEETTPTTPATLYGASKRALGLLAESYARVAGASLAWARIFFVYGPHEPEGRLVPTVVRSLLAGDVAPCTDGTQRRDFLYVGDVADALVWLLWSDAAGTFNIGSGDAVAVRDVALRIAGKLGGRHLLAFGARRSADDEPALVAADITRLRAIGWAPRHTLDSGLDSTIAWWRTAIARQEAGSR
jgi:nucleoside-diphosphate-sugar epimerase